MDYLARGDGDCEGRGALETGARGKGQGERGKLKAKANSGQGKFVQLRAQEIWISTEYGIKGTLPFLVYFDRIPY